MAGAGRCSTGSSTHVADNCGPPAPRGLVQRKDQDYMRVLVVEDECLLADTIAEWLRGEAHAVDVAYDGATALERTDINDYDVIVLDRDLPRVHGDDVCRRLIEADSPARVLMLTASV